MAWVAGAAAVAAAGISAYGASQQSASSVGAAREQMDFQRYMSKTAVQRQVRDMRKAGINPIMSARYGGASTPSGAQPQQIPNIAGRAASSALAAYQITQQVRKLDADIGFVKAATRTEFYKSEREFATIKQLEANRGLTEEQLKLNQITQMIEALKIPGMSNIAAFENAIGPIGKGVAPLGNMANIIRTMRELTRKKK